MGANLMEAARLAKVAKVVAIGTACSYPGYLEGHLKEQDLWAGPCHASVVNYGLTKKMLAVQGEAYKRQYGLDSIHLILTNLYGPGDSYNTERSHVVAALVRKWVEAEHGQGPEHRGLGHRQAGPRVHLRRGLRRRDRAGGGKVQRRGHATEHRHRHRHLDPRAGRRRSTRSPAIEGKIVWNTDKPDGAMMKVLDVTRMKQALDGWAPPTDLKAGLAKTIAWYRANKAQADAKW